MKIEHDSRGGLNYSVLVPANVAGAMFKSHAAVLVPESDLVR